jgi:heme O synthase-like polyprenyltransferase
MTTRTAGMMLAFGFLLMFGAVGGMENPDQADYFLEQCLVALVGMALAFCGSLALNNSEYYDER